jgi:superfamily II DNA helicase RecQ
MGRAGRDGLVSECCLYLCAADVPVLEGFARADA